MRIKIFQEGPKENVPYYMAVGGLKPDSRLGRDQIPVVLSGHFDIVWGLAYDFVRDEDGWISYELEFTPEFLSMNQGLEKRIEQNYDFSLYITDAVGVHGGGYTEGTVRAVTMFIKPGIPKDILNGHKA